MSQDDIDLLADLTDMATTRLPREFEQLAFSIGIEDWIRSVFACNQYVDTQAPWALRKTDPERMRAVLMTLFQAVRTLAIAIRPVVPAAADKLLDQMGIAADARDFVALSDVDWFAKLAASGFTVGQPIALFPRLELPADEIEGEGEA
jgi:methionyl-tRNA synthetase